MTGKKYDIPPKKIKTDFIPAFEELKREIDDKWLNG